ncbi:MAG: hypothetical protein AAF721_24590 [Myxococcota bacterium]
MRSSSSPASTRLFRIAAVLWVVWGLVHMLAGAMTLKLIAEGNTTEAVHNITSAVDIALVSLQYPEPLSALLSQHGFNLFWFGAVTTVCARYVWGGDARAVLLACLVGGLADLGYFLFIDLGGYALPPGPQMTWICAAAIVAGIAGLRMRSGGVGHA